MKQTNDDSKYYRLGYVLVLSDSGEDILFKLDYDNHKATPVQSGSMIGPSPYSVVCKSVYSFKTVGDYLDRLGENKNEWVIEGW